MTISVHCHSDDIEPTVSGGIIVLKKLVKDLRQHGIDANLSTPSNPFPNPDVAVYAEGVHGNSLNGKLCVKWLLYNQPKDFSYDTNEFVFKQLNKFETHQPELVRGILYCFDIDLNFWVDQHKARNGVCFVVRKGVKKVTREAMEVLHGATCIEGFTSNQELLEAFNKYESFVSFDEFTLLSTFAVLCGCNSIIIPSPGVTGEQFRSNLDGTDKFGIAYGDEFEYAESTKHLARPHIESLQQYSRETVTNFINFCRERI